MRKVSKIYSTFISDDLGIIKKQFEHRGFPVLSEEDFCTYFGWKERGRKVKKGEQGRTFTSTNKYAHPIFDGDGIRVDAKGRKVFRKYHAKYNLFHIKQTEPMEVVEMV